MNYGQGLVLQEYGTTTANIRIRRKSRPDSPSIHSSGGNAAL